MNDMRLKVAKSFRMEMVGTGLYRALSSQYRKTEPGLSERFHTFAGHEYMHGKLFGKYFQKTYGKTLQGEGFWIFMGRVAAFMMRAMPLKKKMKKLSIIEAQAVADIEKVLAVSGDDRLNKIMKTILPDEKAHAGLYREVFNTL